MTILRSLQCWPLVQSDALIDFVCFVLIPRALSRTPTYPTVLTIVHRDGTSILSLHNIIYSVATLTIVAACGTDPKSGLSCLRYRSSPQSSACIHGITYVTGDIPLDERIQETIWNTRGWTYQECILSRRLLVFTDSQVFFIVAGGTRAEDTKYLESTYISFEDQTNSLSLWSLPDITRGKSCWDEYCKTIHRFRERELTRQSDTMFAINGVLKVIGRNCNDRFFCGLPTKAFAYALLWQPVGSSERYERWPSCSWAGWTGKVCHPACEAVRFSLSHEDTNEPDFSWAEVTFESSLTELKVPNSDGFEILLHPPNSRNAIQSWINIGDPELKIGYSGRFGIQRKTESSCGVVGTSESHSAVLALSTTELSSENLSLEPQYLRFRSRATLLQLVGICCC